MRQPVGGPHRLVKRKLYPIHIFLIVISGTIGMGLFDNSGEILNIAGPVGGLIAYIIVGIAVICIMEGVAEMIGHWPIANAMVEFVKAFVDKDLAIVVGLAYWYAYAISFATLIIAAANLARYWDWSVVLQDLMFILGVPILLLVVNCLGVFWYGNVEAVMGLLKITLVIGSFLAMCVVNNQDTHAPTPNGKIGGAYINDGFKNNPIVASNPAIAVLVSIPIVAYGYIGVEIVAVTALEAKNPQQSLKYPAKLIAWLTATMYFFCALGFYLNVRWTDPLLPSVPHRIAHGSLTIAPSTNTTQTNAIVVIAILNANKPDLPGFLNGCLIMAVLSAANTALYVASRTLFGLTRELDPHNRYWGWVSKLSTTTHTRRVPAAALFASALAFCWVPLLHLTKSYTDQDLQEIMSGIATVAVVIVWGSLCLAFIRYRRWLRRFRDSEQLAHDYREYNHWAVNNDRVPFSTILGWMQPIPAYIGLIFCILTVFFFATTGWWNRGEKHIDIWSTFVGPVTLAIFWLILKAFRYGNNFEWFVTLGSWEDLQDRLDRLSSALVTDAPVGTNFVEAGGTVFEMNHQFTQSPAPQSQNGLLAEPGDFGYVTTRADTGLGFGLGPGNLAYPDRVRTPSPRAIPSRDLIQTMEQNNRGETRRRPVAGAIPQSSHDDIQVLGQDRRPGDRPGRFQSGFQSGSRQTYDHHPLNPGDGSNVI